MLSKLKSIKDYIEKNRQKVLERFANENIKRIYDEIVSEGPEKISPNIVLVGPSGAGKTSILSWFANRDMGVSSVTQGPIPPKTYEIEVKKGDPKWILIDMGGFGGVETDKKAFEQNENYAKDADILLFVENITNRSLNFDIDRLKQLINCTRTERGITLPVILVLTHVDHVNGVSRDMLSRLEWDSRQKDTLTTRRLREKVNTYLEERKKAFALSDVACASAIPVACYIPEKWKADGNVPGQFEWNLNNLIMELAEHTPLVASSLFWRTLHDKGGKEMHFIGKLVELIMNDSKELIGQNNDDDTVANGFMTILVRYAYELNIIWSQAFIYKRESERIFERIRPRLAKSFRKHKIQIVTRVIENWWGGEEKVKEQKEMPQKITESFLSDEIRKSLKLYREAFVTYAKENGIEYFPSCLD